MEVDVPAAVGFPLFVISAGSVAGTKYGVGVLEELPDGGPNALTCPRVITHRIIAIATPSKM